MHAAQFQYAAHGGSSPPVLDLHHPQAVMAAEPVQQSYGMAETASRSGTPVGTAPYGASNAAASWLGGLGNKGAPERQSGAGGGVEEFHRAIQYVNKIKQRFEDDTETYKQFLDILHAYRKEQNHEDVCSFMPFAKMTS